MSKSHCGLQSIAIAGYVAENLQRLPAYIVEETIRDMEQSVPEKCPYVLEMLVKETV
jgi:hypothetical protein